MKFTLAIYEPAAGFAARTDDALKADYWAGTLGFLAALKEAGVFAGGAGLFPPETATTVRFPGGEPAVQDAPYADVAERLGGYFIIDVADQAAAVSWATRFPRRPGIAVEVRPNLPND